MRRTLLIVLLVVSTCFQGVALAKQVVATWERSGDAAHAMLHAQSVSHHHNHDGSIHKDASKKSRQHLKADGCVSFAALPCSTSDGAGATFAAEAPVIASAGIYDSPFLEGLKRPPR